MKIALIGYSGSGKSTLAAFLGERYHLPVLHIDTIHFLPGWVEREHSDELQRMQQFLRENPSGWVIDGNYSGLEYETRMQQADQIIFLDFNRFSCLFRAWRRYRTYRGKTRESSAPGCCEKFDWEFVRWILKDGRSAAAKERYRLVTNTYREKCVILRTQRELSAFLRTFSD